MQCPHCGHETAAAEAACSVCGEPVKPGDGPQVAAAVLTPPPTASGPLTRGGGTQDHDSVTLAAGDQPTVLSSPDDAATFAAQPTGPATDARTGTPTAYPVPGTGPLTSGQNFGPRYHIIKLLGAGGMGAVYQAWDDELGVAVAVKVIRPEITADPLAAEDLQRRFKRELVLARQVTHKNVVRIHDLGEIDGIKYLTMPYVQGSDLASILKRQKKLPVRHALALARQIVAGLEAAHEAGVVHRDLKPANIMVDAEDHALIMDFGIARSGEGGGTMLGAVVGTIEYMAPEQARAEPVDHRADIYSFGLILSDMLIGRRLSPGADSAVAQLMQRIQKAPPPLHTADPTIPEPLDRIVARCLNPDPSQRYQTTAQLAADLANLDAEGEALAGVAAVGTGMSRKFARARTTAIVIGLLVLAVAAGVLISRRVHNSPPATVVPSQAVSIAIVPFRNASGDASLDALGASLAEILRSELGQSAYLRTVPSDRLRQVLHDLHLTPNSEFDAATLRRLSEFSNAQTIVWGQYLKFGNQIQVLATLQDLRADGGTLTIKAEAASQAALLPAVDALAAQVRQRLAASPEILKQLQAASFRPSSQSFEALRDYTEGVELARQGNHSEAVKRFTLATGKDSGFALAYSKLGQSYASLGQDTEAERFSRKAVDLSGQLSPYEKYLIEANYARVVNDTKKAIAAYENLAKVAPNDSSILFDLGSLYEGAGALDSARDAYSKALANDPKSIDTLLANGRILIKLQKFDDALDYLNRALTLAIQVDNEVGRANILQAMGIAYKQLDKPNDALKYYRDSLEIKRRLGQKAGIASSLSEIGQIQTRLGQVDEAAKTFAEALQIRREIGDKRGIGTVLINLASLYEDRSRLDDALKALREALQIQREVGNENLQALCLNHIGSVYLAKGQFEDALTYFERALSMREKQNVPGELADTLHNLAETSVKMGQYDNSLKQYLRALELRRGAGDRRGTAIESYSTGAIFEYQGRFGAALKAREEALKTFRELKDRSFWMGEILSGYGSTLVQIGRGADAQASLDEALSIAREIGNRVLIAQTLNAQADRLYYGGDAKAARPLYDQALKEASGTSDRYLLLVSKVNVARAAVADQPTAALAARLAVLGEEADEAGLKYLSVECSILRGQTLLAVGQVAPAQQALERAIGRSENLGLRLLQARTHVLLGSAQRTGGDAVQARRHYQEALHIFDEIRKDDRSADIVKRADLSGAYADAVRWSQGG